MEVLVFYILTSDYSFSDIHADTDILAVDFDNSKIIYFKVSDDINLLH